MSPDSADGVLIRSKEETRIRGVLNIAAGFAILSTLLPWFRLGGEGKIRAIIPSTASAIQPATITVSIVILLGMTISLSAKNEVVLAIGASVFSVISFSLWMLGSRNSSLLPKRLVPDSLAIRLHYGADIGVIAGLLLLVALFAFVFESTWPSEVDFSRTAIIAVAAVIGALQISTREASWAELKALDFQWSLTAESIPGLGGVVLFLLLLSAFFVISAGVFKRRWLIVAALVSNLLLLFAGGLGWFFSKSIVSASRWISGRADFLNSTESVVSRGYGPVRMVCVALAGLAFSLFLLLNGRQSDLSAGSLESGGQYFELDQLEDPF